MTEQSLGEAIRADFPILHQQVNDKPLIYLDNAATSQKPTFVLDSITDYYSRWVALMELSGNVWISCCLPLRESSNVRQGYRFKESPYKAGCAGTTRMYTEVCITCLDLPQLDTRQLGVDLPASSMPRITERLSLQKMQARH